MEKILVPAVWYKEMANELARNCMDSKLHVIDLRNRIEPLDLIIEKFMK